MINKQDANKPLYLLKLSGEALKDPNQTDVLDSGSLKHYSSEIAEAVNAGYRLVLVVGGGNIYRGNQDVTPFNRLIGDQMGMLATLFNALGLQRALNQRGVASTLFSTLQTPQLAHLYTPLAVKRTLSSCPVAILGGGIGRGYVSTDTAAALAALELGAKRLIKGTQVDGIYETDPLKDATAQKYERLTHMDLERKKPEVMDRTALNLITQYKLPLLVYNASTQGGLQKALSEKPTIGSYVSS